VQLSLPCVERAQVVDRGECRRVLRTEGFLLASQRSIVHALRFAQFSLVHVEIAQRLKSPFVSVLSHLVAPDTVSASPRMLHQSLLRYPILSCDVFRNV